MLGFIFPAFVSAQSTSPAVSPFPHAWIGKWKGTLVWYQGVQQRPSVPMELHILETDSTDQFTWRIIYGNSKTDNRPYILKPFNKAGGHWLIDERNSIVLDHFLMNNRLCGTFTVQGNTILNTFHLTGDSLVVEFYNIQEKPIVITGGKDSTVPAIKTYGMRSFQQAILKKSP